MCLPPADMLYLPQSHCDSIQRGQQIFGWDLGPNRCPSTRFAYNLLQSNRTRHTTTHPAQQSKTDAERTEKGPNRTWVIRSLLSNSHHRHLTTVHSVWKFHAWRPNGSFCTIIICNLCVWGLQMACILCTRYTDLLGLLIGPRRDDMVVQIPHHNCHQKFIKEPMTHMMS